MVQSPVFFQLLSLLASWQLPNTLRHVVEEVGFQTLGVAPNLKKYSITGCMTQWGWLGGIRKYVLRP